MNSDGIRARHDAQPTHGPQCITTIVRFGSADLSAGYGPARIRLYHRTGVAEFDVIAARMSGVTVEVEGEGR